MMTVMLILVVVEGALAGAALSFAFGLLSEFNRLKNELAHAKNRAAVAFERGIETARQKAKRDLQKHMTELRHRQMEQEQARRDAKTAQLRDEIAA